MPVDRGLPVNPQPRLPTGGYPSGMPNPLGNTSSFNWIQGHNLPVRAGMVGGQQFEGGLENLRNPGGTSRQLTDAFTNLSGQNVDDFWGSFTRALPKGKVAGPTRYF